MKKYSIKLVAALLVVASLLFIFAGCKSGQASKDVIKVVMAARGNKVYGIETVLKKLGGDIGYKLAAAETDNRILIYPAAGSSKAMLGAEVTIVNDGDNAYYAIVEIAEGDADESRSKKIKKNKKDGIFGVKGGTMKISADALAIAIEYALSNKDANFDKDLVKKTFSSLKTDSADSTDIEDYCKALGIQVKHGATGSLDLYGAKGKFLRISCEGTIVIVSADTKNDDEVFYKTRDEAYEKGHTLIIDGLSCRVTDNSMRAIFACIDALGAKKNVNIGELLTGNGFTYRNGKEFVKNDCRISFDLKDDDVIVSVKSDDADISIRCNVSESGDCAYKIDGVESISECCFETDVLVSRITPMLNFAIYSSNTRSK